MKINPTSNNSVVNTVSTARNAGGNRAAAPTSGKGNVELSPAARHLANLQNTDHDVNLERVQQIRDAIASGQLKVNTERIADSLLASARELLK